LRDFLQDRPALLNCFIRSEYQCKGTNHEHDRAPGGRLGQNVRGTAWPESGLTAGPAKSACQISGFAALQQYHDDKYHAVDHEEASQQPTGVAKADRDNSHSY
jgi:hypothetical protein